MDRALPDREPRGRGPPPRRPRTVPPAYPRDGVKKNRRDERQDLDNDWVHDRYDDEPSPRDGYSAKPRRDRRDDYHDGRDRDRDRDWDRDRNHDHVRERGRRSPEIDLLRESGKDKMPPPAKIRVDNLHYDLTEDDLFDLFTRIAPVKDVRLTYDRAGRSEGIAFVTYDFIADARSAVREFDGANAKGQPIRLTILPLPPKSAKRENPFDRVENPRSLFDRIEVPSGPRRGRSDSPTAEIDRDYSRNSSRRGPGGAARDRRTDTTRPAPENIDRYIPGQNGRGGRPPGVRRERPARDPARPGARPKKTAAELDAEMDDYWGSGDNKPETTHAPQGAAAGADDDIDMIE